MGSWRCSYASMSTKNLPNPNTDITDLTPRERHQKILVREAAKIARVSEKTFRENYEHLIHKLTKRCHRVDLQDALTLPLASERDVRPMNTAAAATTANSHSEK